MGDWWTTAGEGASTSAGNAGQAASFADYLNSTQAGPTETAAMNLGTVNQAYAPSYMGANAPTATPVDVGWFDKGGAVDTFLRDYEMGKRSGMMDAWRNRGLNAQTAGYVGNKLEGLMGMAPRGGGAQPANITANQNNADPWATLYARYYRR